MTYFVTWRVHPAQSELSPDERSLVLTALRHFNGQRYVLHAYVVMNDHVHVLVTPSEGHALERLVHSWKSFTAKQMQQTKWRKGSIWQDEYMDRIVRDESEFLEKATYILNNPLKRWPEIETYAWVGHEGEH